MKYRATSDGFLGKGPTVRRVRAGEVFDLPAGLKPSWWMESLADAPKAAKPAPKKSEPQTFSELSKG